MSAAEPASSELRDYLAIFWKRRWWVLGIAALVVAGAIVYTTLEAPRYASQAKILVQSPQWSAGDLGQATPDMETERELAESSTVAREVVRNGFGTDPDKLLNDLSVSIPTDTQILVVTFTADTPSAARDGAAAFAQAFIDQRQRRFQDDVNALIEPIATQISTLQGTLNSLHAEIESTTDNAKKASLQTRADILTTEIAQLEQRRTEITTGSIVSVGQVEDPASIPTHPTNRGWPQTIALALVVGLFLGLAAALIRDRFDDRPRSEDELEARSGAPTLGSIPRISSERRFRSELLIDDPDVPSTVVDAYRLLRASFTYAVDRTGARVILVTSPEPGDGKTTVAANLAASLGYAGHPVLLISADLRRPRLPEIFSTPEDPGFASVLRGEAEIDAVAVACDVPNLRIVPPGSIERGDIELLRPDSLSWIFGALRQKSPGLVLLDAPPVLGVPDTLALAQAADASLLVIDAERTTRSAIDRATRQLTLVDVVVMGDVLNKISPSGSGYHYGYYGDRDVRHEARQPSGPMMESEAVPLAEPEPEPESAPKRAPAPTRSRAAAARARRSADGDGTSVDDRPVADVSSGEGVRR
jgi:tyrosine-protein kinase